VIQSKRICNESVLLTDINEAKDYELNSRLVGSTRLAHFQFGWVLEVINGMNLRIDNLTIQMQQGYSIKSINVSLKLKEDLQTRLQIAIPMILNLLK